MSSRLTFDDGEVTWGNESRSSVNFDVLMVGYDTICTMRRARLDGLVRIQEFKKSLSARVLLYLN